MHRFWRSSFNLKIVHPSLDFIIPKWYIINIPIWDIYGKDGKIMKRILTLLLAIVMVVSAGLISFNVGVKVGEERAKVNLEVPTPSTPGQPKPSESQPLPSSPGDSRPGQTKPDDPTPTQPVPCSHEFVGGTCKHCGALKPTERLDRYLLQI